MSPRFVLGRENVPCVAEVVNKSLKADCTDFNHSEKVKNPIFSILTTLSCLDALKESFNLL